MASTWACSSGTTDSATRSTRWPRSSPRSKPIQNDHFQVRTGAKGRFNVIGRGCIFQKSGRPGPSPSFSIIPPFAPTRTTWSGGLTPANIEEEGASMPHCFNGAGWLRKMLVFDRKLEVDPVYRISNLRPCSLRTWTGRRSCWPPGRRWKRITSLKNGWSAVLWGARNASKPDRQGVF